MRHTKKLLSLTAVVLLAACTDNSLTNPFGDVVGTYQLTIYANATLPIHFTVQPGQDSDLPNGGTWDITGGSLDLRRDGSFTETNLITKTPSGGSAFAADFVSNGTYSVSGANIQFAAPPQNNINGRSFTGQISQDRINYTEFDPPTGLTFAYEYRR